MDLSVIIVSWKTKELARRLLVSIFKFTSGVNFEVFVVDNDSQDGTVEMVKNDFKSVKLIANYKNFGFAKACNQAITQSAGELVLLLNPDAELFDNALLKMVNWMKEKNNVSIVGGKVLNPDHSIQKTVRHFPDFLSQAMVMLKMHHFLPKAKVVRCYFASNFDYEKEQEVDQVIGAFFCIRRNVFEKIGLLDEKFFLWYEEVDFCKRARDAGLKIFYTPSFSVIHHGGESFRQVLAFTKQRYLNQSLLVYAQKYFTKNQFYFLKIISPLSLALAWFVQTIGLRPRAYKKRECHSRESGNPQ